MQRGGDKLPRRPQTREAARMGSNLECRECGSEIEASQGTLLDGWHYTKTEDEMAAPRG